MSASTISRRLISAAPLLSPEGSAPLLNGNNEIVPDNSGNPLLISITSLERYRRTLLFQGRADLRVSAAARRNSRSPAGIQKPV